MKTYLFVITAAFVAITPAQATEIKNVQPDSVAVTSQEDTHAAHKKQDALKISSKFGHNYLELAKGDSKMAEIFAAGEVEIVNNPKVSEKRLERTVKRYVGALNELADNDGKGRQITTDFLVKYVPNTAEMFKGLGGEFYQTYRIISADKRIEAANKEIETLDKGIAAADKRIAAADKRIEEENKKQEAYDRLGKAISSLQK